MTLFYVVETGVQRMKLSGIRRLIIVEIKVSSVSQAN